MTQEKSISSLEQQIEEKEDEIVRLRKDIDQAKPFADSSTNTSIALIQDKLIKLTLELQSKGSELREIKSQYVGKSIHIIIASES